MHIAYAPTLTADLHHGSLWDAGLRTMIPAVNWVLNIINREEQPQQQQQQPQQLQALTMSGRDGSPKISLSMLKGRSSNQSVPSISYRFNPSDENIRQISDPEEEEEDLAGEGSLGLGLEADSVAVLRPESLRDPSPVKEYLSRSFGKRSSSLDSNSGPLVEPSPPQKTPETGSLLSRITKNFEEKINEIRKEKYGKGEKDKLGLSAEGSVESDGGGSACGDRSPSSTREKKVVDVAQRMVEEEKVSLRVEMTGSPSKTAKTTLVQDITEHTSKFKSELGSIRPKLSELRNRRSSQRESGKGGKEGTKSKPSVFTSLLGRDEGLGEDMLLECDEAEVDRAVEAQEDACVFSEDFSLTEDDPKTTERDLPDHIKAPTPKSSPKRLVPQQDQPSVSEHPKNLTLRDQAAELLMKLPISMSSMYQLCIVVFLLAFVLPIPSFLAGLMIGVLVSGAVFFCLLHLLLPPTPDQTFPVDDGPVFLTLPAYEDKQLNKGWVNELEGEYSPDSYHVSHTHSVFIRLQGSKLKIDHPRGKVPKHVRHKEEIRNTGFTQHREYDIAGCQVLLLPRNLPRRWLWSRKYPICIRLQVGSKESSPSPVSIASTPTGSAQGSPSHYPNLDLGRQGSSESGEGNWSLDNNKSSGEDDLMTSSLDMGSFEQVTRDMCQETSLIIFARSDREKDDWFRRLVAASQLSSTPRPPQASPSHHKASTAAASSLDTGDTILLEGIPEMGSVTPGKEQERAPTPPEMSFERYMARLLYQPGMRGTEGGDGTPTPANVAWINALAGRVFYDFLRNPYWANKVQERVQRKLSKLHVPYFVGEVVVCGVNMGSATPQLCAVGSPQVDNRGLWVDLKVEYSGNFTMSLETKLDLMKLKRTTGLDTSSHGSHSASSPPSPGEPANSSTKVYTRSPSSDGLLRNLHFETDTDDSVESSSEEEGEEEGGLAAEAGLPVGGSGPTSRKLLKLVDTVAASRYFQQAAEWKLLQRALQGVSNTRIELSVEVRRLAGTLALNVPPPPADRLWYGFRGNPELVMVARPRLGDRVLNLPFLVEFIQKQLKVIFEKVFVIPNMDDIVIPIMSPLLPGQTQPVKPPWESMGYGAASTTDSSQPVPIKSATSTVSMITPIVKFTPSSH
ncbi:hypothetical protein Pcinc_031009 [Petrolisthes cinctipes]|uniref:SMP-LTD domain-containing protein n=1 Tax=Petrolisthes cinctipes TaxID=88211 RepID=A0AAE1EWZ0_PETCI|nr:hypothetical protein Pcinc_031009 [Petrolisthes cinctipes]